MNLTRPVDLARLSATLGIPLGTRGATLHTYSGSEPSPLPAGHDAAIAAEQDAYAADVSAAASATTERTAATDDLREQYAAALTLLDGIIGTASFTNATRDAAIKDLARVQRRMLRLLKAALT